MNWTKSVIVGLTGSLVMFVFIFLGIHVTGIAPFNTPPSAAFLSILGLDIGPLPLLAHFGYGAAGSVAFAALFFERVDLARGLAFAVGLWLIMMLAYAPVIGWGLFGTADAASLPPPLHLGSTPKFIGITLFLHLIYGAIIGYGNRAWSLESKTIRPSSKTSV